MQPVANGSLGDALRNPDGSEYLNGQMQFAATLFGVRSDSRSPIDVLEWKTPGPYGEAYAEPNHLGINRVALEVDDIAAARGRLIESGHPASDVEEWDMGEFGKRQVVVFKDPDGIMLELIEHLPIPTDHPPFA